jgi:YD repeat-containing protein
MNILAYPLSATQTSCYTYDKNGQHASQTDASGTV